MSDDRDVSQATPAPAGALCALHPTVAADGICARCGNYMCAYCSAARAATECVACRERAGSDGFPFDREHWGVFALLDYAWQVFRHYWLRLTLLSAASLITNQVIGAGLGAAIGGGGPTKFSARVVALFGVTVLVQLLIGLAFSLAVSTWSLRAVDRQPLEVEQLIGALRRMPQALLAMAMMMAPPLAVVVVVGAFAAVPLLTGRATLSSMGALAAPLLIVFVLVLAPLAIYFTLGVVFTMIALVRDPSLGAWDAIRQSWEMARGHRWRLFGATILVTIIASAGVVLCFVGVFATTAYASLFLACVYNALRIKEAGR